MADMKEAVFKYIKAAWLNAVEAENLKEKGQRLLVYDALMQIIIETGEKDNLDKVFPEMTADPDAMQYLKDLEKCDLA